MTENDLGLEIFSHQTYDFTIQSLRGIKAPDKIKMVPIWKEFEVAEIWNLGKYPGHILRCYEDIMSTSPNGSGHLHGCQVIDGRATLREKKSNQERQS